MWTAPLLAVHLFLAAAFFESFVLAVALYVALVHSGRKVAIRTTRTTEGDVQVNSSVHLWPQITQNPQTQSSRHRSLCCHRPTVVSVRLLFSVYQLNAELAIFNAIICCELTGMVIDINLSCMRAAPTRPKS